jgi:hypothetical protein
VRGFFWSACADDSDYDEDGTLTTHPLQCTFFTPASIPLIIMSSDILYGLASGMTIKFFPLFFKDIVGLSPVALHFVLAAQPISIAIGSLIVRGVAHMAGTIPYQPLTTTLVSTYRSPCRAINCVGGNCTLHVKLRTLCNVDHLISLIGSPNAMIFLLHGYAKFALMHCATIPVTGAASTHKKWL